MNSNKFLVLLIALLFTLTLLSTSAFALTYRADVNDGSWSQYTSGLSSGYYAYDTGKATYERDFEFANTYSDGECDGYFCHLGSVGATINTSTNYAHSGTYSLYIYNTVEERIMRRD